MCGMSLCKEGISQILWAKGLCLYKGGRPYKGKGLSLQAKLSFIKGPHHLKDVKKGGGGPFMMKLTLMSIVIMLRLMMFNMMTKFCNNMSMIILITLQNVDMWYDERIMLMIMMTMHDDADDDDDDA
eukprot:1184908-Amphidinium_carterae.2